MMIGITMGDASGVGPELLLRAHAEGALKHPFVAYGDLAALELAQEKLGFTTDIHLSGQPADRKEGALNLINLDQLGRDEIAIGEVSAASGKAAVLYVKTAVEAALAGTIDAFCTLPIHKDACRQTYPDFIGHTEFVADMCGVEDYLMMLAGPQIACTFVSTHVSLREAVDLVKTDRILKVIRITHQTVTRLRPQCRIAVLGLNPHAGEAGAFGTEEREEILPAIQQAQAEGIDAQGPFPPDTLFRKALAGDFDAVVCMYHDQGHIPMKTIAFEDSVNVTVGLPILRTSVDHGTAFDIAYQGIASTKNLVTAFKMAAQLVEGRHAAEAQNQEP